MKYLCQDIALKVLQLPIIKCFEIFLLQNKLMLGWSNPLPIGQSGSTLTYLVERIMEVGGKKFSRLPAKRGVIAHLTTTLQIFYTLSLIVFLHHTIIKLPIPHTVYRQILYF